MSNAIRVLVVDDAIVVRRVVSEALESDPEIAVVGTASDGKIALSKIAELKPDVLILDIEMPVCDGFEVLRELRRMRSRLWIVMFSSLTQRGAEQTIEALSLGAHDYISKPTSTSAHTGFRAGIQDVARHLIPKIKQFKSIRPGIALAETQKAKPKPYLGQIKTLQPPEVIAIGISTGGPEALAKLLPKLPKSFPLPILIVQHMPPFFTKLLAERLNSDAHIDVKEGEEGMPIRPGVAYIAPGGSHLYVHQQAGKISLALNQDPPENSCRPSADVLFRSVAELYGNRALGIIMTGMGRDGLKGLRMLKEKGGSVIAQDQATSVIWGMPAAVVNEGLAECVLPLDQIAGAMQGCLGIKV